MEIVRYDKPFAKRAARCMRTRVPQGYTVAESRDRPNLKDLALPILAVHPDGNELFAYQVAWHITARDIDQAVKGFMDEQLKRETLRRGNVAGFYGGFRVGSAGAAASTRIGRRLFEQCVPANGSLG